MFQLRISGSIARSLEQCPQVAVCEEAAHIEISGNCVLDQLAVTLHLRHMVAAHRHIKPDLPVGAHQGELIGVALIMEKFREVGLVAFDIAHMDEGDALSKVTRNTA